MGLLAVDDLTTCKQAAEAFGHQFRGTEDLAIWPKGCYEASSDVYFNQHINGSARSNAAQICKDDGRWIGLFLNFYQSIDIIF